MQVSITLKGFEKVSRKFRDAPKKIGSGLQLALEQTGVYATGQVKEVITSGSRMFKPPIKTGAMRRGIQVFERRAGNVVIRPSDITPYAKYVHEGTSRMKARPFFEITKSLKEREIQKFFEGRLSGVITKAFQ